MIFILKTASLKRFHHVLLFNVKEESTLCTHLRAHAAYNARMQLHLYVMYMHIV